MRTYYLFILSCCFVCICITTTTFASTKGTEFWYAHVDNGSSISQTEGDTRAYLYIYAERATTVRAYASTISWDTTVVAMQGLTTVVLPLNAVNTGLFVAHGHGVHITADDSVSIIAHAGNRRIDRNGPGHKDAALLLPVPALGHEYYVATSQVAHGFHAHASTSKLLVVATEDSTEIEITPTDTTVPEYPMGVPFTITLNRGEMFGLHSSPYLKNTLQDTTADLTGTHIRASAPVAVFGGTFGSVSSMEEPLRAAYDYMFEQMPPVSVLGREYILTPVLGTPDNYLCRVFAMYDSTLLTVNGEPPLLLRRGEMYDRTTREVLFVQSDKPVSVYQYIQNMTDSDSVNFGAHAFAAVQPIEQMSIRRAMFPDVPFNLPYRQTFVNILLRTEDLASPIELDGAVINDSFAVVPAEPGYSYARLRIPYGRTGHTIASLKPFIAYVYGSGSNPHYADYASPVYFHSLGGGGGNLLLSARADADTVCPDSTVSFTGHLQMALDTAGTLWRWDFGDNSSAEGPAVQHRYKEPGTYTVTLSLHKGRFLLVDPVRLTVTVAAPDVQSTPSLVDFGEVSPCAPTTGQVLTLRNTGSRHAVLDNASWRSNAGLFSVVSSSFPLTLGVGDEHSLHLRFHSPGLPGLWRDTLRLLVEPCGGVLEIAVVAEVLPGSITAEPASLQVGVLSGCSAVQKDTTLTVRNTGQQQITLSSAVLPAPFSVLNLPAPVVLPVGEEYRLALRFAPSTPGVYAEQLQIAYSYADCRDTLRLPVAGELRGTPVEARSGGDTTICPGVAVRLWAEGGVSYRWQPADGLDDPASATPTAAPEVTTAYTVTVTSESGCTGSSVVLVQVRPAPELTVRGGGICRGESLRLSAGGADSYQWSPQTGLDDPQAAEPLASPQATTTYTVTGWSNGCSTTAEVTVEVSEPPVVTLPGDTSICLGEGVVLAADVRTQDPVLYRWTPQAGLDDPQAAAPLASPQSTTVYTVEVEDDNGCRATATVQVEVRPPSLLSVVVPDVVAAAEHFEVPVVAHIPQQRLPVDVQLRVALRYPSSMMLVEQVQGATVLEDVKVGDRLRRIVLQTDVQTAQTAGTVVAVVHARALLTAQQQGQILPVDVEVLQGDCMAIDSAGNGLLKVDSYCQGHDYRRFTPLNVQVRPQPLKEEATVEVTTSVAGSYRAVLYDSYGRAVWQAEWLHSSGASGIGTIGRNHPAGLYMLRVEGSGQTAQTTVVITK